MLGLYDQLLSLFEVETNGNETYQSIGAWAEGTPLILDGRQFTFNKHEYLRTPYLDDHPYMVEIKAAQLGLTTKAMLKAMYQARYRKYRGILYLFPSKSDVLDFSKGRISPFDRRQSGVIG
jgi:hypothetical protein